MAIVSYNSKRVEPAPFVTISKSYQTTGDGQKLGSIFNIQLNGTILSFKGSPDSTGVFYDGSNYWPDGRTEPTFNESVDNNSRLGAILRKQEAFRDLFKDEGKSLEIQSFDGTPPMKCNPRNFQITFNQGLWYQRCEYTITCQADVMYVNGNAVGEDDFTEYVAAANETWAIETIETPENEFNLRTYRLTHNVSAQGKRFYDETGTLEKEPWQQARDFVVPRLGYDATFAASSGVRDIPTFVSGYNHLRTENIDELAGTYSVQESWLLSSGAATEEFNVDTVTNRQGRSTATINGTIRGLEIRDVNLGIVSTKFVGASGYFDSISGDLYNRAASPSQLGNLNPVPLSESLGKNKLQGIITYGYSFDTRPTNLLSSALTELIEINNSFGVDVFGQVPVLGRTKGPVLQDLGTFAAKTKSLSIEAFYPTSGVTDLLGPLYNPTYSGEIQNVINQIVPGSQRFVNSQSYNWNPSDGQFSYNLAWTYED